ADAAAAGQLGAARAVLARELSLAEIAAASAVPGLRTEVFVQGALCYSVSGRCLLSSWVGGRSGNRGACTSPCRVPWSVAGESAGTPLSMRDLAAVHRLDDLRRAGVAALKIEGRLKNADWVRRAVGLYRRALDGPARDPQVLLGEAAALGDYTGRTMTCAYLDARREELTGAAAGRAAAEGFSPPEANEPEDYGESPEPSDQPTSIAAAATYDLDISVGPRSVECRCTCGGRTETWTIPKTVVRRAHKAVAVGSLLEHLATIPLQGCRLDRGTTNDPEFLLVARASNALVDRISAALRLARKPADDLVRIVLPKSVLTVLDKSPRHPENHRSLGDPPDRARLEASAVAAFLQEVRPEGGLIVEGVLPGRLDRLLAACGRVPVVVALPQVFFDEDLPAVRDLVGQCARAGVTVEVNSWGAWHLARQSGAPMESGPGLPVLNTLAARSLGELGIRGVTLSPEADRRQYEDMTAYCSVPCSLVVFGRPPLMTTRVRVPDEHLGKLFADRRGTRLIPRRERGLVVYRPESPFDLRATANDRIHVAHLVVDLVGSPDPVGEWYDRPQRKAFRFNYDRSLA
ncbi:MAG: U32 family peptidase, partial [Thermoguttaceae bacterium]|nr:U32 family peptidase [Thermoguttaceae bacterium]